MVLVVHLIVAAFSAQYGKRKRGLYAGWSLY
jgi:hypothetical protein